MLYDASWAGNFAPEWFDPVYWSGPGRDRGRGARPRHDAVFISAGSLRLALRHYRRGGLLGKLVRDTYLSGRAPRGRSPSGC